MIPIIEVKDLSKVYQINHDPKASYGSLREDALKMVKKPFRVIRKSEAKREEFWALKDVNFTVNRGEVVGIIGRNGAGKSTLLKILSRITYPTSGKAILNGRVASLLEVGTGFHPELTGRENIFLNGAILGMSRKEIERKFNDIVAFSEVEKFLDTPVKYYSSGMYVRLAFAVAAHLDPEILIIDEVLSVGDAQFQKKSLGKMQETARSGRTVIFVSHNMSSIKQLCSRALWIDKGQVRSFGPVEEVVENYLKESVGSASRIDLSNFHSAYGNKEVSVKYIELVNAVGKSFSLPWDDNLNLKIKYKVGNKDLDNVSFDLGVQTLDGIPIFTNRSSDVFKNGSFLKANSEINVNVVIKHRLRSGHYIFVLGISSGSSVYYYNPSVAQLDVLDVGKGTYLYKNLGYVFFDAKWELI